VGIDILEGILNSNFSFRIYISCCELLSSCRKFEETYFCRVAGHKVTQVLFVVYGLSASFISVKRNR
jgi:hypothetical protein